MSDLEKEFPSIYLGLVHGPVLNKRGKIVTTSVTNLDIHDIARTARTYGMKNYFIITSLHVQHELLGRILHHWEEDHSGDYNPDRQDALRYIQLSFTIEEACQKIAEWEGQSPLVAVTGARLATVHGDPLDLLKKIKLDNRPLLVLFGTGWGLSPQVIDHADFCLRPLAGQAKDGYNHLSVRAAVAIYCDRLTMKA